MNISSPSSTITGTNPNSISSDDVDLEFGADPNTTSSPTPSIITPDHPAFVGCPTAAVQDTYLRSAAVMLIFSKHLPSSSMQKHR